MQILVKLQLKSKEKGHDMYIDKPLTEYQDYYDYVQGPSDKTSLW